MMKKTRHSAIFLNFLFFFYNETTREPIIRGCVSIYLSTVHASASIIIIILLRQYIDNKNNACPNQSFYLGKKTHTCNIIYISIHTKINSNDVKKEKKKNKKHVIIILCTF